MIRRFLTILVVMCGMLMSKAALASHFRYGTIAWRVPDPQNAPLTVDFTVTTAWRAASVDGTALNFGDGAVDPFTTGATIGTGTDTLGQGYVVTQYTTTHTYAAAGDYTAFFTNCCRIAGLQNGANADFRVETLVSLVAGNTAGPVTASPAIIQMQVGGVRTQLFPAFDPDGDPVTCRLATDAEVGFTGSVPTTPGGTLPTVSTDPSGGCLVTWDVTSATVGQQYVLHIVLESTHGGSTSTTAVDLIIEMISSPLPTCAGSGTIIANPGQTINQQTTGTNTGGGTLNVSAIGAPAGATLTPTTGASPLTTTFSWTPAAGDAGTTHVVLVNYQNAQNVTGTCALTIQVPQCQNYGDPCSAGVGACQQAGQIVCAGPNVSVCNAVPGMPTAELCDNIDNDCDGTIDNGNPEGGQACMTGLFGVCSAGTSECQMGGMLVCNANIQPGTQAETCNNLDDNCDGSTDEGFGLGNACSNGVGECAAAGQVVCDAMGGTTCDAVPGMPTAELCDNLDNDCDGAIDNGNPGSGQICSTGLQGVCSGGLTTCAMGGMIQCVPNIQPGTQTETCNFEDDDCDGMADEDFNVGSSCTNGLGICMATGQIICDGMGGATCDAVPGMPQQEICGDMLDSDCDGNNDNGCLDSDGDGIFDDVETQYGTDPNDADSDDDGVIDGEEPNWNQDTDGDGLINALDPDSDNDGLFDGTEMGKDCSNPATDLSKKNCIADGDMGQTTTDPLDADTDDGGVNDGIEDTNRNGVVDPGERNPTTGNGGDDMPMQQVDTDGDGIPDDVEILIGTDPNDADSDDDGVLDGQEPNWADDTDGDGLINPLDPDSDNDGLFDGTEMGLDCSNPATDTTKMNCTPDGDMGQTTTSPIDPDTDDGGVSDGAEDTNRNGVLDAGETDPTTGHGDDDMSKVDTDGDGIPDDVEILIGTDPNDADSDDDGVKDGDEPNWSDDTDGDGKINPLDPDSDNDGILDGTEMGTDCMDPSTDTTKMNCVPDGDMGATTTSPVNPDTDFGGIPDGEEDKNHNGVIDAGETDPNDPADDTQHECKQDSDCGGPTSGKVCDTSTDKCVDGCRGTNGNGCPDGEVCSSMDDTIGTCMSGTGGAGGGGMGGMGGMGGTGGAEPLGIVVQGNGILCTASPANDNGDASWILGAALGALVLARRKRR